MSPEKVKEFQTRLSTLGEQTKALVLVDVTHEGKCALQLEGSLETLCYASKALDSFLSEAISGRAAPATSDLEPKKVPKSIPPERPSFVWLRPCQHCPTAHGPGDPESEMLASIPERWRRMRHTFACGWRPKGYCAANYKQQFYGMSEKEGLSENENDACSVQN